MSADKEKIILKRDRLDGVDKSIYDYTQVHTVPIVRATITKQMFKKGKNTYIGLNERVVQGQYIRVNNSRIVYRVMKVERLDPHYKNIYKILRSDGSNIVQLDIDAAMKGSKVSILRMRDTFLNKTCKKCMTSKCNGKCK